MRLPEATRRLLRCPVCRSELRPEDTELRCTDETCATLFPVVDGIPVLINEARSLFAIADYRNHRPTTMRPPSRLARLAAALLPDISHNLRARANYARFAGLLGPGPRRVLVVGGGSEGRGMRPLLEAPALELTETDVTFGRRTQLICDAHDLPFADGSFDGVVVQAVHQNVVDPYRCVEEIHRVLTSDGVVYAETPFMQQVHLGRYDFTRFTHLGQRRLFRHFEEIGSGVLAGPGTALAWACRYFLLGFVKSRTAIGLVKAWTRLSLFWLKYFDYWFDERPGAFDGSSAFYFLGRRATAVLSDRDLIQMYRGAL
jgi:SAM-dependent methyltransferase